MRSIIPVVLFLLAVWFSLGPSEVSLPVSPRAAVSAADLSTSPKRVLPARLDEIRIGGLEQKCSDCHSLFETVERTPDQLQQHTDIVFDHGLNNRCLNCHAREDHNQLELYGGELVPLSDSHVLCSKCHGPTYRDWEEGMHGRTMGSWQTDDPAFRRLICIECHDPHAPAFGSIVPLPAPNAWRAPPSVYHESSPGLNPLRRRSSEADGDSHGSDRREEGHR
jgi:hypothetical protein